MANIPIILIAGPYRSGTGDLPSKMARNLEALEAFALPLYRKGYLPLIGEWIALPLIREAGSKKAGDEVYESLAYPVASRMLRHCDAVLRVPGESKGADQDVKLARERGLPVYRSIEEVPDANA